MIHFQGRDVKIDYWQSSKQNYCDSIWHFLLLNNNSRKTRTVSSIKTVCKLFRGSENITIRIYQLDKHKSAFTFEAVQQRREKWKFTLSDLKIAMTTVWVFANCKSFGICFSKSCYEWWLMWPRELLWLFG